MTSKRDDLRPTRAGPSARLISCRPSKPARARTPSASPLKRKAGPAHDRRRARSGAAAMPFGRGSLAVAALRDMRALRALDDGGAAPRRKGSRRAGSFPLRADPGATPSGAAAGRMSMARVTPEGSRSGKMGKKEPSGIPRPRPGPRVCHCRAIAGERPCPGEPGHGRQPSDRLGLCQPGLRLPPVSSRRCAAASKRRSGGRDGGLIAVRGNAVKNEYRTCGQLQAM